MTGGLIDLGPHAAYIWAAYGAVVLVISALTGWIVVDARRQRDRLAELEAQGITRRSARGDAARQDGQPE